MGSEIEQPVYTWLGMHIFYDGDVDELLKRSIAPFVSRWKSFLSPISPWFFIRYWEGGSHIRLRFQAEPIYHEQIIEALNRDFFQFQYAEFKVEKVLTVDYLPEINRYGNEESILWAEQHFAISSACILNWLLIRNTTSQILIQAIRLHLTLLFCTQWKLEKLITICDFFIKGWLPKLYRPEFSIETEKQYWLNQFEQALSPKKELLCLAAEAFWKELNEDTIADELAKYKTSNLEMMNQYKNAGFNEFKLQEIISSLMHMTNNRLGIANQEEAYLMYVVKTCINAIRQTNHSN
ncbi:thiopeptide-type bacteriocin biosynthesis protein [Pedobacter sp. N23S346]|uniref:thiopeptide-type bacteriocin biosynthesis protein n=1 Tax=Pedobacter sp. N23S346 TaxID=3402750 RepID=UPI003ABFAEB6